MTIKRTISQNGFVSKDERPLKIQREISLGSKIYEPKAIVCHHGDEIHDGHYTAYLTRDIENKYGLIRCNDSNIDFFPIERCCFPREN